jgi:hypothetical protein
MTLDEARTLLPRYAEGSLEAAQAREVESLLADTPELQAQLRALKEEEELLQEAFAPLRSTKSARMRLSDAMQDAHRKARRMAESLPEYGWRITRLCFGLLALIAAAALAYNSPPSESVLVQMPMFFYAIIGLYGIGLLFVLGGRTLSQWEARLLRKVAVPDAKPAALEVLTVEVFGVFAVLASLAMYLWMLPH